MTGLSAGHRRRRWSVLAVVTGCVVSAAACGDLLDVENPNNVLGEDLLDPQSMDRLANGALYTLQEGYGYMLAPYSTVSNELHWIGSRDAWFELELGTPDNPANEFTDLAFAFFAPGRWMSDEAIRILRDHAQSDVAEVRTRAEELLARAYLYGAIAYVVAGDWFDDFALSDREVSGPPLGEEGMGQLYDTATVYLDRGLAIVGGSGSELERNLLAMRARTRHAQSIWTRVGIRPIDVSNPLVADANAATDAAAALAIDDTDWRFGFDYGAATVWSDIGWQVNDRLELRFGDEYVVPTSDDNTRDTEAPDRGVRLQDPIDGIGDPRLDAVMTAFEAGGLYADLTILSAREMYLILAEDALANGVVTGAGSFDSYINTLRGLDELTPWVSGGVGMPAAQDLLIHERRVNLYLQGRRLSDLYRFDLQGSSWQAARPAVTNPGTFLPITRIERDANCHMNPEFSC